MAIYWTSYSAGNVYMMVYNKDDINNMLRLSKTSLDILQKDLNDSFSAKAVKEFQMRPDDKGIEVRKRNVGLIQRAYVFTWDGMKNGFGSNKVIILYLFNDNYLINI